MLHQSFQDTQGLARKSYTIKKQFIKNTKGKKFAIYLRLDQNGDPDILEGDFCLFSPKLQQNFNTFLSCNFLVIDNKTQLIQI